MNIITMPSPNHDTRPDGAALDMLVLHYTGMPTAEGALARLCDPAATVSAHYTLDEDGTIYAHVDEAQRAWHAGVSWWAGETNVNARSIGIEIVNPGHGHGYRPFPEAQIAALMELCQGILDRHAIPAARIVGHSDVAPTRKEDPGELFPWQPLAKEGIGLWPKPTDQELSADALERFGYDPRAPRDAVITAFQRHFRPHLLNGAWDAECGRLLAGLLA